jgi:hypothetical protein
MAQLEPAQLRRAHAGVDQEEQYRPVARHHHALMVTLLLARDGCRAPIGDWRPRAGA